MKRRTEPILQTFAAGDHSSITFSPADYTVTTSPTALTFTANCGTVITIGHPPPPRPPNNASFALKTGEQLTLSANDGQVTILSYQLFTIPDRPLRIRKKPARRR
jgi:hypothetical protein